MNDIHNISFSKDPADLRQRAEERLRTRTAAIQPQLSGTGLEQLLFELEVHQLELEMQNAELRTSTARLNSTLQKFVDLFDFAPVGYFNLDINGVIRDVNLAGARIVGVERSTLTGWNFESFIVDEARSLFRDFLLNVFSSRVKESGEFPLTKTATLPSFVKVDAELSECGQVCRFVVSDISDRKHAEMQLNEMTTQLEQRVAARTAELASVNEKLRVEIIEHKITGDLLTLANQEWLNTFNATSDPILLMDRKQQIYRANKAMLDLVGLPANEFIGRSCHELLHGTLLPTDLCPHRKMLDDGMSHTEEIYVEKLDKTFLVTVSPVFDAGNTLSGSIHYAKDITERKHAETVREELNKTLEKRVRERTLELQISEERLQLALKAANAGIWERDIRTGTIFWSEGFWNLYGLNPDDFRLSNHNWLRAIHPKDRRKAVRLVNKAETEGSELDMEYRVCLKDGTERWLMSRGKPLLGRDDKPEHYIGIVMDITDRKHSEQKLLHLTTFPEFNPDIVIEVDTSGTVTYFNPAMARTLEKLNLDEASVVRFLPEDFPGILSTLDSFENNTYYYEVVVENRIFGEKIFMVPHLGVARIYSKDITEIKSVRKALQQSELRYQTLFNTLQEGFCIIEVLFDDNDRPVDYRFLEYNPSFEIQTGMQNVQGKMIRELFPQMDAHWFEIYGKVALTGEPVRFENEVKALNRWFDISAYRIDGDISRKVAILVNDITAIKLKEEALEKSEERLQLATSIAKEAIWEIDFSTGASRWNRAYTEMLGQPPENILHDKWWFQHVHPDDQERVRNSFEHALAKTTNLWRCNYRMMDIDGNILFISDRAIIVRDISGTSLRAIGAKHDITEHVRDKEEIVRLNEKLNRRVAELQLILDTSPVGLAITHDPHCANISGNPALDTIFGVSAGNNYAMSPQPNPKYTIRKSGTYVTPVEFPLQRAVRGETVTKDSLEVVRDDGTVISLLASAAPLFNPAGEICGAVGSFLDITDRKLAEEALVESEQQVRKKLDSILSPEGNISDLDLRDIIDVRALQLLLNDFYRVSRIPVGIHNMKGETLVAAGWQEVCLKFHRVHPETSRNCRESDLNLVKGIPPGEYMIYKCKNNMWDISMPLMVGGVQFGNIFTGQFFFDDEQPDYDLFQAQAARYGFDEKAYLEALDKAPRLSRESIVSGMACFTGLAELVSKLGYSNIKLARSVSERDILTNSLRSSEERFRILADTVPGLTWTARPDGSIDYVNKFGLDYSGITDVRNVPEWAIKIVHPDDREGTRQVFKHSLKTGVPYQREHRLQRFDGVYRWHLSRGVPLRDAEGRIIQWYGTSIDIHDLREAQQKMNDMAFSLAIAEERERCRIAGELHDQVAPNLMLSRMKLNTLPSMLPLDEQECSFESIDKLLEQSIIDIRSLTFQLRPPILANAGLEAALKWLGEEFRENYGLMVSITHDKETVHLRYEVRSTIFQVIRELLLNIVKHAGTLNVDIGLKRESDMLIIVVKDDGVGFDVPSILFSRIDPNGYGLFNIQQKIEYFNGHMLFESSPGCGTRVTINLPLTP